MIIWNSNVARKACGLVAAATIAAAWHVTATGQATLTITFPDRIVAGPDFATDVLKNAWDFSDAADISPDPGDTANWTSFSVAGGVAGGQAQTDDASMGLLFSGFYTTVNPGQNGVTHPIDSTRYQKLAFRMSASLAGNDPQVHYFHTTWLDPADTATAPDFDRNHGLVVASKTINGYKTFVVDMTQGNLENTWTSGNGIVRALRLDPNNTPAPVFGGTGAGQYFYYDWARLTYADNAPGSAMQNIQWDNVGSGPTTIDVYDGTNTTLILNVTTTASGGSYSWNSGVLPPGAYTFRISRTGATGTKAFTINTPPTVTVTDPSRTTGQDYATTVLGNAWDMSGPEDVVTIGSEGITPNPPDFTGGILTATNTNNDPNITLLHNNNNALGTKAINSAKYRYLTYRMEIDGAVDIGNGSIARVLWASGALPGAFTTTRDIFVFKGMQSYTLDLASFLDAPAGGIDPTAPGGSNEPWFASNKQHFRFDPHEFGTNPGDPTPQRTFHIDDIKLTANPVAFGSYTIHFTAADADSGDTAIVNLYRDDDRDPDNGKTLIAAGLTAASGSYLWNTSSVPEGTYYIYAEATDTWQLGGSYADAPLVVSAPCNYALAPTTGSVPNSGGSSSFGITTGGACDWNVVSNNSFITVTSSLVGTGNGTISYAVAANPARTVRTGTLTAGGQTFTVTQLATPGPFDYDGDGRADRTVYSPGSGMWSTQNGTTRQYGLPGDMPVPGDYDGNGVLDTAVYRPSTGDWFVQNQAPFNWGRAGDVPMPADYNGDGITDAAVYRTTDGPGGVFFVRNQFVKAWGLRGDIPLAADFDGDHKADLAAFRPSTGQWFVTFSAFNYTTTATYTWGAGGDVPATGDFDGDGKADLVAYRPTTGEWFIAFSGVAPAYSTNAHYAWGVPGDVPLALDMDGDRVDELVVYRRADATWWTYNRVTGATDGTQFGATGDLAVFERPQFHAPPTADFDGDHRADLTVFRPGTGEWYTRASATNYTTSSYLQWGLNGDVKVPGDYDGDGKTDVAVFRPSDQVWYLRFSSTGFGTSLAVQWGITGDVAVPADYDGDGSTDLAVYRPSSGQWFLRLSANDFTTFQVDQFGLSTDIPVPADYDGDGRADLAVYRPSSGQWYLKLSSGAFGGVIVKQFGLPSDVPVPSDWDGDGRADLAVFRPSTGVWFGTDALTTIRYNDRVWGASGDVPVTQDFDGDGVMDSAVFHPSTGQWFVKLSSTTTGTISIQWGLSNDQPLYRIGG